jgi:hypothetical protein
MVCTTHPPYAGGWNGSTSIFEKLSSGQQRGIVKKESTHLFKLSTPLTSSVNSGILTTWNSSYNSSI